MDHEDSGADSMGTVGSWLAVGFVVLLLLLVPGFLLFSMPRSIGSYSTYVVLAILPALAFGIYGVWTALRHRG
ncbi:MAG: hypothetical protein ABEJ58_10545 [Halodesulfurarchaeum sp.]